MTRARWNDGGVEMMRACWNIRIPSLCHSGDVLAGIQRLKEYPNWLDLWDHFVGIENTGYRPILEYRERGLRLIYAITRTTSSNCHS